MYLYISVCLISFKLYVYIFEFTYKVLIIFYYCYIIIIIVSRRGPLILFDVQQEHFPSVVERNEKGRKKLRRCQLCATYGRGRKRTHVYCAACPGQPGLCVDTCFKQHHKLK